MTISTESDGAVGFGTSSPDARVHFVGAAPRPGTGLLRSVGTIVYGDGSRFSELRVGDMILVGDDERVVVAIESDSELEVISAFDSDVEAFTAFSYQKPISR